MAQQFEPGMIVAYYANAGAIPSGWAICDGTNGTPDLRDKYLVGVDALADVGKNAGNEKHNHNVTIRGTTDGARRVSDGWGFDGPDRGKSPQATGLDHQHDFGGSGTTDYSYNAPPSVTVIFLMKL
jgi:hypothetical protein